MRSTVEENLRMGFAVAWVVGEAPRALPLGLADFLRLGVTTRSRPHPADGPDLFCGASSTMHVAATPTGKWCCAQTALLTSKVLGKQRSMLSKIIGMQKVRTRTDPNPTKHAVLYSSLHRRPVSGCPTKCELSFGEEAMGRAGSWLHIPHFVTRVPFCMLVGIFEYVRTASVGLL